MRKRRLETALLASPHAMRAAAANMVAFRLDRMRRRGEAYRQGLSLIDDYHSAEPESFRRRQGERLQEFLDQTAGEVPYYRDRPTGRGTDAFESLASWPLLSKADARGAGQGLFHPRLLKKRHYVGHTSGSTGTPFSFRLSFESLRLRFGLRDAFYLLHGFDFEELNVRLGGRLFIPAERSRPPFWLRDRFANQLMFSIYHLGGRADADFIEALERHDASFITGYPSSIHLLARACERLGSSFRPRGVFSDSETVHDFQRDRVRNVWGCEIHDSYGLEVGWVAGQCRLGAYHVSPLTSVVEILAENGEPAPPGEVGEIVVTDMTNLLMPLVRYRTGDVGAWSSSPCDCGWNTPSLAFIQGRIDDVVLLPDGRKVGRLDHIFKLAKCIKEAQIIQETPSDFAILVVPEDGYGPDEERDILNEARKRLGSATRIKIREVPQIPRTARGKFRSVISKVRPSD